MATTDPVSTSHELDRRPWAERRFAFGQPPWMIADFIERLRGLAPRVTGLVEGLPRELARRQLEGSWSIAQNIGHLADVEDLWQERLDDLLHGREVYTPADPRRFALAAERHQERSLAEIIPELAERRSRLVKALTALTPADQLRSAFHARLQCPMRPVDCAQFVAEHDDHHLLRVRTLRRLLGSPAD
jgi:uncharacterized damage-inducible protein DinB